MSRSVFINTCMLLAVTTQAHAQYVDFFNSFLQPFTTNKPKNDVTKRPDTKHRQTNKQKHQDVIFFETDDFLKQRENSRTVDPFAIYSTTTKPRRKSKTTTSHSNIYTTSKPKNVNSNIIITNNVNNHEIDRTVSNNNGDNVVDRVVNNARRIDNYNNGYDNLYNNYNLYGETTKAANIYGSYNNNRQTTQRPTNNFNRKTTQKTDYYGQTTKRPSIANYNRPTTRNPLLNRPGVKPAVIDDDRPPITNKPVTERPGFERPFNSQTYRPPTEPRPVNTRPPFETERPISTGVVQPVSNVGTSNEDVDINIELGPDEEEMSDAEKRRLYEICEKKCDEYKSMRVRKVVALPLGGAGAHAAEVNVSSCAPDDVPLIVGGQLARIETFPHMALLGWKLVQSAGYAWKCGGSLISERYVLTAGHCTYHDKDYNVISGPPGVVQLGSSIYNDRSATIARVELVVRHPKYKLRRSYHDVALLKLAVEISFSETISPACLGVPPAVGEPVIATGWGKTEFGGDSSVQLRSVSIPIWDMDDCRDIWGTSLRLPNGPMPDNQVCAGEKAGAKDTCQGDSGGPAQVRDGCSWRVVAVTSVGRSCGAAETPALYALVPRAFVAKQAFTNIKSGRDGNNQYGNAGSNNQNTGTNNRNTGNNNQNTGTNNRNTGNVNQNTGTNNRNTGNVNQNTGTINWNTGTNNRNTGNNNQNTGTTNRNTGNVNQNTATNNWNTGTNNWNSGTNNVNTGTNNWNAGNNWNTGNNNNGAGINNRGTVSDQNAYSSVVNTRLTENNRPNNNNAGIPANNNQYYGNNQESSTENRIVNNNNGNNYYLTDRTNNWEATSNNNNNNRYNQNNGNVPTYDNTKQTTTNTYTLNNFGQNNYNGQNNFRQNGYNTEMSQNGYTEIKKVTVEEIPTVIRNFGTQNGYNDNGNNRYTSNIYTGASRPWWAK